MLPPSDTAQNNFFFSSSSMSRLFRSYPWAGTPLGDPASWPQSLKASVNLLLNSRFPMFIWWGADFITLYNDAYKIILGDKHPALGKPGPVVWKEIWDVVGPLANDVLHNGNATWAEDQLLYINRQGFLEESYFTFSYSPIYDEAGKIAGVFCACTETTEKVKATRRIQKSERNLHNIILQAPVAMCIFRGNHFVVEIANERMIAFWGKNSEQVVGKPIFEGLPEASNQGFEALLQAVYTTGETFSAYGVPVSLPRGGNLEKVYVNFVYEALREEDESISGVMAVAIDVTLQVLHQQKIEQSEQEVRSLVESAPFPIGVYVGEEMQVKMANQSLVQVWGKGPDVVGKPLAALLPELESTGIFEQLHRVYTTGNAYHDKNQRIEFMTDGVLKPYYFNFNLTPLFDNEGVVYGVMNTAAEVTDLNLALKKTKEAEEKARLAIESADLGTFEVDYYTNQVQASPRFEHIAGLASSNPLPDFVALIQPEYQLVREKALETARHTGNLAYEAAFMRHQTELRWARIAGQIMFDAAEKPRRLIGVIQDITEQKLFAAELEKQVQERTQAVKEAQATLLQSFHYLQQIINKFETALASLVPVFEQGEIVDFYFKMTNAAYSQYSKILPEDIVNKRVSEVFPGYLKTDAFRKYVNTYVSGQSDSWDLHYNEDELDLFLTVSCNRMNDEVVVHFTDFTKMKSLQLDLVRKIEELQRSNRNLEDFAYAASHDLKEPIRKIHFYSDRLKSEIRDKLSGQQLAHFTKLETATLRMRSLVDDLLSYSQVNLRPRAMKKVDLNQLIGLVLTDLELEVTEKDAVINIEALPLIHGYPRQLQQLFQNLISNALKYKSADRRLVIGISCREVKGTEVPIAISSEASLKTYYQLSVTDNGIGFNQQEAERIFQVFQRLHINQDYKGTGVGLSIARKVAENHQGFIWATGRQDSGASFNVLLPIHPDAG